MSLNQQFIESSIPHERILSPVDNMWDSFFMSSEGVSEDFMTERASQEQSQRESF